MDTSDGPGGYRGGYQGRSGGGFGRGGRSGGGRNYYNDGGYQGGSYQGRGGYQGDGGYQGGYQGRNYNPNYDGGRGGRGGGRNYNDGAYQGGYQGGRGGGYNANYNEGGGGYNDGGYQGGYQGGRGGGGRFYEDRGGGRRSFGRGRSQGAWRNQGDKRTPQNTNAALPPNLKLVNTISAHQQSITSMVYEPSLNALFTGSKDGKVKQWDCGTGQCQHEEVLGGPVDAILFVGGYLFVAYRKGAGEARNQEGIIQVYNTGAGSSQMLPGHRGYINQLQVWNQQLFSAGSDSSIRVWGLQNDVFVCRSILDKDNGGHAAPVHCIEFIGTFMFSADGHGTVKIWDASTGSCTQTVANAHAGTIYTMIIYNQINLLTCSADGMLKVWELVNPPMPGNVMKPTAIDTFFEDESDGQRGRGNYRQGGLANGILTMEGTADNKGESILLVSKVFDQAVRVYNADQHMALQGMLPEVPSCRAITSIAGQAVIVGDDKGQVHIYAWA